jgi:hypothetical protein
VPVSCIEQVEIKRLQPTSCHSALAQAGALRSNQPNRILSNRGPQSLSTKMRRDGTGDVVLYVIEVGCAYLSRAVRAPTSLDSAGPALYKSSDTRPPVLPQMSGFELLSVIRRRYPQIKSHCHQRSL